MVDDDVRRGRLAGIQWYERGSRQANGNMAGWDMWVFLTGHCETDYETEYDMFSGIIKKVWPMRGGAVTRNPGGRAERV